MLKEVHRQDFSQALATNQVCHSVCPYEDQGLMLSALAECTIHVNMNNIFEETSLV